MYHAFQTPLTCFKRLLKSVEEIRLAVIKAFEGTEIQNRLFLRDFQAVFIGNTNRASESEIRFSIISETFNKHKGPPE